MNEEHYKTKIKIMQKSVALHEKTGGPLTMHNISDETEYTPAEIFNYFNSVKEIKRFYYTALIFRYEAMVDEIEYFDSYTISEKLSNFIYSSFDMMSEHSAFVQATFKPFIVCGCEKSNYQKQIENIFSRFVKNDKSLSASGSLVLNKYALKLLQYKYVTLVLFWLNDTSQGKATTMELTDKLTGLLQEILYTSVTDRSIDLIKFLYTNNVYPKNTFINKVTSTFEIR